MVDRSGWETEMYGVELAISIAATTAFVILPCLATVRIRYNSNRDLVAVVAESHEICSAAQPLTSFHIYTVLLPSICFANPSFLNCCDLMFYEDMISRFPCKWI